MRKTQLLRIFAFLLILIAGAISIFIFIKTPKTLTVSVGPIGSSPLAYMHSIAKALEEFKQPFRFNVIVSNGSTQSAAELDRGTIDLAVLRSDNNTSHEAQSIAVIQRRSVIIVTRKDRQIKNFLALRGKSLGILSNGHDSNRAFVNRLFEYYRIDPKEVKLSEKGFDAIRSEMSAGQLDAFIAVSFAGSRQLRLLISEIAESAEVELVFSGPIAAEALAIRNKDIILSKLPAGIFGGHPPKPPTRIDTIAITYEIVATSKKAESVVTALTKTLMGLRTRLRHGFENDFALEVPSTTEARRYLPHAGTVAYFNDSAQSFLEAYSDLIWMGLFILSILGSAVMGLIGWISLSPDKENPALMQQVSEFMKRITSAVTLSEIDQIENDFSEAIRCQVLQYGFRKNGRTKQIDAEGLIPLLSLMIENRRKRIAEK